MLLALIQASLFAGGFVSASGWGNDKDACNSLLILITGYELADVQQVVEHVFQYSLRNRDCACHRCSLAADCVQVFDSKICLFDLLSVVSGPLPPPRSKVCMKINLFGAMKRTLVNKVRYAKKR